MFNRLTLFFCSILVFSTTGIFANFNDSEKPKDTLKKFVLPNITIVSDRENENILARPISQILHSQISKTYTTNDLPLVLSELPSIYSYSQNGNGIGYSTLIMRGFDQRRIAVNINGIPQNDPEDHNVYWIDFPDITSNLELVEVQRGAGRTNYGFASIGGSINLITSNFVNKRGVKIFSGFGFQEFSSLNKIKHNTSKYTLEASSGLIPASNESTYYSVYTRFSSINSFGYRNQSFAELSSYFFGFARFDDKLSTQINIFGGPIRDGLAYYGIPKEYIYDKSLRLQNYNYWSYDSTGKTVSFTQLRRPQEIEEFSQPHFELLNDIKLNENSHIRSALFYYTGKGFFDYDGTGWTDAKSFELNERNGYPNAKDPQNPIIKGFVDNTQFGWIPSFLFEKSFYKLKIGGEFRFHNSIHWGKLQYAENLPSNYNPDFLFYYYEGERIISSLYASYTRPLTSNLSLDIDGQIVYHNYAIQNDKAGNFYRIFYTKEGEKVAKGKLFSINYLFFNPRIGIEFSLNPQNKFFAFTAITSREPRMANLYNASEAFTGKLPQFESSYDSLRKQVIYDFSKPLVKPERLYDFELGYNLTLASLNFSTNVYYMLYNNELVKSGQLSIFGDPIDGNAPKTYHLGIELTLKYQLALFDDYKLILNGNTTISKNKIIDYQFELGNGQKAKLNGNDIPGFPSLMGNLRISFANSDLFASLQYQYVGSYRTDSFGDLLQSDPRIKEYLGWDYYNDNTLDAFGILNFDFVYNLRALSYFTNIQLQFKVNNLTNKLYASGAEGKEFFPGAERNIFFGLGIEF